MKKKLTLKREVEKTIKLLIVTMGVLIVTLTVLFLMQTGEQSQKGYKLQQTRLQNEQLKSLSENLKADVTSASTSSSFEDSLKEKGMEEPPKDTEKYLLPKDND